jgi:hypothetical protein
VCNGECAPGKSQGEIRWKGSEKGERRGERETICDRFPSSSSFTLISTSLGVQSQVNIKSSSQQQEVSHLTQFKGKFAPKKEKGLALSNGFAYSFFPELTMGHTGLP